MVPGGRQPILLLQGVSPPPTPSALGSPLTPRETPTLPLAAWDRPCSQMLLQAGGACPVTHQHLVTCACSPFLTDPAAQAGAGAVAGCTQHLGALGNRAAEGPPAHPLGPGCHSRCLVGEAGAGLKVIYLITAVWSLATREGGGLGGPGKGQWVPPGSSPPPPSESPYSHFS